MPSGRLNARVIRDIFRISIHYQFVITLVFCCCKLCSVSRCEEAAVVGVLVSTFCFLVY